MRKTGEYEAPPRKPSDLSRVIAAGAVEGERPHAVPVAVGSRSALTTQVAPAGTEKLAEAFGHVSTW